MPKRYRSAESARKPHFIKEWREFRNLTQESLAARLDTSIATVSRIETGLQPYTQDTLEAFADALSCQPADLIMRNPMDPEAPWSIWETLKPAQRRQAIELMRALKRSDDEAAA